MPWRQFVSTSTVGEGERHPPGTLLHEDSRAVDVLTHALRQGRDPPRVQSRARSVLNSYERLKREVEEAEAASQRREAETEKATRDAEELRQVRERERREAEGQVHQCREELSEVRQVAKQLFTELAGQLEEAGGEAARVAAENESLREELRRFESPGAAQAKSIQGRLDLLAETVVNLSLEVEEGLEEALRLRGLAEQAEAQQKAAQTAYLQLKSVVDVSQEAAAARHKHSAVQRRHDARTHLATLSFLLHRLESQGAAFRHYTASKHPSKHQELQVLTSAFDARATELRRRVDDFEARRARFLDLP